MTKPNTPISEDLLTSISYLQQMIDCNYEDWEVEMLEFVRDFLSRRAIEIAESVAPSVKELAAGDSDWSTWTKPEPDLLERGREAKKMYRCDCRFCEEHLSIKQAGVVKLTDNPGLTS